MTRRCLSSFLLLQSFEMLDFVKSVRRRGGRLGTRNGVSDLLYDERRVGTGWEGVRMGERSIFRRSEGRGAEVEWWVGQSHFESVLFTPQRLSSKMGALERLWGVWTVVSGDADEEGDATSGTWIGQSHLERMRSIT